MTRKDLAFTSRMGVVEDFGQDAGSLVESTDNADHFSIALLWNPFGEFNIGLVYRYGPEFEITNVYWNNISGTTFRTKTSFKIPDVYAIGLSWRPFTGLTFAVDLNHVRYSEILDDFVFFNGSETSGTLDVSDFDVDDENEIHAGLEFVFDIQDTPFAVRCGYFYRPEHRIRYEGPEAATRIIVKEGDDAHIFSLGFGAVLFENVQLDVAGSMGDFIKEFTLSFVYRFGD